MRTARLLIVDDDQIVLDSCRRVFDAEGYEVDLALSADAALAALERRRPDLVIVDIKMPHHDGVWCMRRIKERYPDQPIIVISGYAVPEMKNLARAEGAAEFVPKPFTPEELLDVVQAILGKEPQRENPKNSSD